MKLQSKLFLSAIFVLVLLCFTFISVKQTTVRHWKKAKRGEAVIQNISVKPSDFIHREKTKKEETVSRIIEYLRDENGALEDKRLKAISEMIYDESVRYNLDYRLVLALMKIESNFRHDAVSKRGARGLLQVKPSVAKFVAEDVGIRWQGDETLDEPEENIKIGLNVFFKLIQNFQNINLALHAYHVGPTRLREILTEEKVPQKRYVNLVLTEYDRNVIILPAP